MVYGSGPRVQTKQLLDLYGVKQGKEAPLWSRSNGYQPAWLVATQSKNEGGKRKKEEEGGRRTEGGEGGSNLELLQWLPASLAGSHTEQERGRKEEEGGRRTEGGEGGSTLVSDFRFQISGFIFQISDFRSQI